jgi:prepilin-type N-terminal cleavage/methylation domain-containing protein
MKKPTLVRGDRRGFTLVELMVALVAGLIVTLAVVGLARTATRTFYEQARLSTTEGSVRNGAERLRQDLSRTSFMSTGNIHLARNDSTSVPFGQKISHVPGAVTPARYTALKDLQGLRIIVGGSAAAAPLSVANGLNPDSLELTGNFTTDDSYRGKIEGNVITLNAVSDVAVARLIAGGDPNQAVHNAFCPGTVAPAATKPHMARVVDPRGCQHFVVISAVSGTSTGATITLAPPDSGGSPVLTPAQDESTCGANDQEEVTISPIQKVRWYLAETSDALKPDVAVEPKNRKYDLSREILDATGAAIPAPGGPQVVAEYAIDLKFGLGVDDPALLPPASQRNLDMDTDGALITDYTKAASLTLPGRAGPQRVRSVRFRLATRAALDDRRQDMKLIPLLPQYISRYCTELPLATCTKWARVRTIMSEVTLMNQLGMGY